jgi:hypothetical protein
MTHLSQPCFGIASSIKSKEGRIERSCFFLGSSRKKTIQGYEKSEQDHGLTAAAVLSVGRPLRAVQISGEITFTGSVNLNTASAGTATAVTGWHGFGGNGIQR